MKKVVHNLYRVIETLKPSHTDTTRTFTGCFEIHPESISWIKDTEVLMKTMYPIRFLYSNHERKPDSISGSDNKARFSGRIAMISHQLIFESKAKDVFWILYSNAQAKKQLTQLSEDCCQ